MVDIDIPSNPSTDTSKPTSAATPKKKPFNKKINKKTKPKKASGNNDQKSRPMTTGMALLQAMTAKKAATDAMIKSAKAKVHVSFDDDGEIATTPTEEETDTNDKKRKERDDDADDLDKNKAPKKEKKKKGTHHLRGPSDKKKQEALDSLQLFVNDRSQWKFNKKHQSWLLQHMYDTEAIATEDFDRLLLYIKDIMGMAREKTLKEAQTICQETRGSAAPITTSSETTYTGYDDYDDFDAEKLLAAAPAPAPAATNEATNDATTTSNSDDSVKLERAKAVVKTLM